MVWVVINNDGSTHDFLHVPYLLELFWDLSRLHLPSIIHQFQSTTPKQSCFSHAMNGVLQQKLWPTQNTKTKLLRRSACTVSVVSSGARIQSTTTVLSSQSKHSKHQRKPSMDKDIPHMIVGQYTTKRVRKTDGAYQQRWVLHGHNCPNEERFVSNLADQNHRETI